MITPQAVKKFACGKFEGNIGEAVEQQESYVMKWKL